jgi:hypothetical protein
MPKCRCGVDIIFGITLRGKSVPLAAKPEKRYISVTGAPVTDRTGVKLVDTYLPHFVDCPFADDFRKK